MMDKRMELPDLTVPDDLSDVALKVEGKLLHFNRVFLASASPVWKQMFKPGFREHKSPVIPLPDKSYDDVHKLLLCILPATQKPITDKNVASLLPLVDEWQMVKLKADCEKVMIKQLEVAKKSSNLMFDYLMKSLTFSLDQLREKSIELISCSSLRRIENHPEIPSDTLTIILKKRVSNLEKDKLFVHRTLNEMGLVNQRQFSHNQCTNKLRIMDEEEHVPEVCIECQLLFIKAKISDLLKERDWSVL